jgi:amidase
MTAAVGATNRATATVLERVVIQSSATELVQMIRDKKTSCEEIVRACLARMDAVHGRINAVVFRDDERALTRAGEADRALANGEVWGPLHGLPITISDWPWKSSPGPVPMIRSLFQLC